MHTKKNDATILSSQLLMVEKLEMKTLNQAL